MRRGAPSHVDLTVGDLERSRSFYDAVLGRLGYRRPARAAADAPISWFLFDADGSYFSLGLQLARGPGADRAHDRYARGLHHLAFHVKTRGEVDAFHRFLLESRVEVLDAPAEYDYTPGYYAVFFADPDGLKLEVVYEPPTSDPQRCCPFCGVRREGDECAACGLRVA